MTDRSAAAGLFLLAVLAWTASFVSPALRDLRGPEGAVAYREGEAGPWRWAPAARLPAGAAAEGRVVGPAADLLAPVGGWEGLLLGQPLDLNTATAEDLDALPGVGPTTAAAILQERARLGRFGAVEELSAVPGIGARTLERLRPLVAVRETAD